MLDIGAPKSGYDHPVKESYRTAVWDALLKDYTGTGDVLIMPSREGLEIDLLISRGVPADKIVAVDKSAAVIATSVWRKKHPHVRFHTTTVGAFHRKQKNPVELANLDFCSNFNMGLVEEVGSFFRNTYRVKGMAFAVTVLRGREGPVTVELIKHLGFPDAGDVRISALFGLSSPSMVLENLAVGNYIMSRSPMVWGAYRDVTAEAQRLADRDVEEFRRLFNQEFERCWEKAKSRDFAFREMDVFFKESDAFMSGKLMYRNPFGGAALKMERIYK